MYIETNEMYIHSSQTIFASNAMPMLIMSVPPDLIHSRNLNPAVLPADLLIRETAIITSPCLRGAAVMRIAQHPELVAVSPGGLGGRRL